MRFSKLLFALAALLIAGPGLAPRLVAADPPLWRVSDGDTTLYLFGTIHALDGGQAWFGGRVRDAFDASDTLAMEIAPDSIARSAGDLARLGAIGPGPALPDRLPPAERARLRELLADKGLAPDALDRTAPWMAAILLSTAPLADAGYDPAIGVEAVLGQAAANGDKPVIGIESAAAQYRLFAALPAKDQIAMLTRVIDAPDAPLVLTQRSTAAWARGDLAALDKMLTDDLASAPPSFARSLVGDRNRRFAEWISARLDRPGSVFVAIGVGHLAGPGNVRQMLEQHGLRVERIE